MEYSFPHYLLSKQTVDDRALNKDVVDALRLHLPPEPLSVIEVGAGIGTMLRRLVEWNLLCRGVYVMVDAIEENLAYARDWIPEWAAGVGLSVERTGESHLHICDRSRDLHIHLEGMDVFDFIQKNEKPADVLIAHAFLDLLPVSQSIRPLLSLTRRLAWLTINFDGISALHPVTDCELDEKIEHLYHASMDKRPGGGDSRMGRHLFEHLRAMDAEILAAGASDWVVYAKDGRYPADEKYFLQFILHFFESALKASRELDPLTLECWLAKRHAQIERGELVYIAHQMDFLVNSKSAG